MRFILWFNMPPKVANIHIVEKTTKGLGLFQPYSPLKSNTKVEFEGPTKIF
jgi:hypothetical protein